MTNPAPVAWIDLLRQANEIVRNKPTWKRFIDGTPLSNDIAVWMADFAESQLRQAKADALREIATHEFFNGLYISDAMTTHLINKLRRMADEIEGEK